MTRTELADTIAALRSALAAEAEQSAQAAAAAVKTTGRLQELLALAARVEALAGAPVPDPDPDPIPDPPPSPVPAGANTVRVAGQAWPLAAVDPTATTNPPGATFPGFRGPNQLVAYTQAGARTGTNQYGTEVSVAAGVIGTVTVGRAGGITVPDGGLVLSGHGRADAWLQQVCRPGAAVEFLHVDTPTPPPVPTSGRAGNIALWVMMWSNSTRFDWAAIPDEVDEVRLSFFVNDGQLVGYGPWGKEELQKGLKTFLTGRPNRPGRFVSFAMGGGGYEVSIPSVAAYVANVKAKERDLFTLPDGTVFGQFMGANVDWESDRFKAGGDAVAKVLRTFKQERPGFYCSWSPNGSFKGDYAAVCKANPDVVDDLNFQSYDIHNLTYEQVIDKVYTPVILPSGIRPENLGIAMMIEPPRDDRWTLAQCQDAARRIRADLGITKTSFWHAGRPESGAWAKAMRQINPV